MKIEDIENEFLSGDRQRIEMMARGILCNGRTHKFINDLSLHAEHFNELLKKTNSSDRSYLALVYILGRHLTGVKNGKCACSIVREDMFNSPSRLEGILEIMEESFNKEEYSHTVLSRCLSCGRKYESKEVECGHGRRVLWN